MMEKLVWYWQRLQRMSFAEAVFRAETHFANNFQQFFGRNINIPDPKKIRTGIFFDLESEYFSEQAYCQAADEILEGRLDLFSLKGFLIGNEPKWTTDPKTGTQSPMTFGKKLNYRNTNIVGNIKYLWELNRHLHLITLAQAYHISKNRKYLDAIKSHLTSWFEQNPYLMGPNWASSLELAIRLINWGITWELIGGEDSEIFKDTDGKKLNKSWLDSIYQHVTFIHNYYSQFSSANNHLIGEAAGVYIATKFWPYWEAFEKWGKTAKHVLIKEARNQTYSDGVNKEQAISYQQFVLDFFLITALIGKKAQDEFPIEYWTSIEKMMEFIFSIMDVSGNVPMIGDADDGFVVRLSQEQDFCPYKSLLASGAFLFNRSDFRKKAGKVDDKTRFLLGHLAEKYDDVDAVVSTKAKKQFPEGGYYILGFDAQTDNELQVVVDSGPLGYLSIAAHGHADALSFTLFYGGKEFLIDPGTYSYHANKEWRNYFRSTAAHNTLRVDGQDQSVMTGNFMWSEKAEVCLDKFLSTSKEDIFQGSHNGYSRLSDPVRHVRTINLNKPQREMSIVDMLNCKERHQVETYWHFSENCEVKVVGSTIYVKQEGKSIQVVFEDNAKLLKYEASLSPLSGWISRSFDKKVPCTTVIAAYEINGTSLIKTDLLFY
jgi:hypothetical protein